MTEQEFYSHNDNIVYDYLYYGESNGNFIFKENKNKIILRSCDSGYIEYYRDDGVEVDEMKYKIEIKETLSKVIEVEAKDEGEALRKIEERHKNSEIILDSGDYIKTEIQVYRDKRKKQSAIAIRKCGIAGSLCFYWMFSNLKLKLFLYIVISEGK